MTCSLFSQGGVFFFWEHVAEPLGLLGPSCGSKVLGAPWRHIGDGCASPERPGEIWRMPSSLNSKWNNTPSHQVVTCRAHIMGKAIEITLPKSCFQSVSRTIPPASLPSLQRDPGRPAIPDTDLSSSMSAGEHLASTLLQRKSSIPTLTTGRRVILCHLSYKSCTGSPNFFPPTVRHLIPSRVPPPCFCDYPRYPWCDLQKSAEVLPGPCAPSHHPPELWGCRKNRPLWRP